MRIVGICATVGGAFLLSLAIPTPSGSGAFAFAGGLLLVLAGARAAIKGTFN